MRAMRVRVGAITKPEVEFMRNKSMSSSRSLARLMVLALCFVMMFTLAFVVVGQLGIVDNSDVAVADNEDDNEAKGGIASVVADQGEITASMFQGVTSKQTGFPGTSATETQWTTTITFNNTVFGSNNVSNYLSSGSDNFGGVVGATGSFTASEFDKNGKETDHGLYSPHLYSVVNYTFSDFMLRLMASSDYTVTATMTSTLTKNEKTSSYNDIHFLLLATSSKLKATEGAQDNGVNLDISDGNVKSAWKSESLKSGDKTATTGSQTFTATNSYLVMGWETQSGWNNHCDYTISKISITFTITQNSGVADGESYSHSDGLAPVASTQYSIANDYSKGVSGSGYAPNITNASDAPVYYSSIEGKIKLDEVSNGAGKLQSYTNAEIGQIEGVNYYKYAQTEYVDLYNYSGEGSIDATIKKYGTDSAKLMGAGDRIFGVDSSGNITATATTDDTHLHYASGIKTVTVNNATFNMWDSTDYSKTKEITIKDANDKDATIGYAQVKYLNRSRVVVMLYMKDNGTVQTTVEDYGGLSNKTKLVVSGIDTKAPTDDTELSYEDGDYISESLSEIDWFRDDSLKANWSIAVSEDTTSADYSPYIWFYSVDRSDTTNFRTLATYDDYEAVKSAGLIPIACGNSLSSFTYDFASGVANGGVSGGADAKGAGYYRFTFYLFDLAGNKGSVNTYYMKVDYEDVKYTFNMSFGKNSILPSQNGTWATEDISLTFNISDYVEYALGEGETWRSIAGFSGYTLSFEIDGEYHALVFDGYGEHKNGIAGISRDKYVTSLISYVSPSEVISVSDNTITIEVVTDIGILPVVVSYVDDKSGDGKVLTLTIKAKEGINFAWTTKFETNPGEYTSVNDIEELVGYVNPDWKSGVQMLLDCTKPEMPNMTDSDSAEKEYLGAFGGYDKLPTDRVWYTGTLKNYLANIEFYDDIIESIYADKLNVYYAFKIVKTLDDLKALGEKNIESLIASGKYDDSTFNKIASQNGNSFDSMSAEVEIDLIAGLNAGMRMFYVWAEDQAGNKSDVNTYYVLADTNSYTISASVVSSLAKGSANIAFTDADGSAATTFKRGDTVLFSLGVSDNYAPYYLRVNGTKILENYTPEAKDWTNATGAEAQRYYISTSAYSAVSYVVDDTTTLDKLETAHKFEFAHRKVVDYTIASTRVSYTAKETDVMANTVFDNDTEEKAFKANFYDVDGNILDYVPKNVGNYKVALYIPKDNDTYVTNDFAMNESGEQVFSPVDYEIIKGNAIISATASSSIYGEAIVLKYTVSGIDVSADLLEDTLKDEGIEFELQLKVDGWGTSSICGVGSYQIVCKDNWSGAQNYDVVFESAMHTVAQREVYVYALGESKQYKEADPALRFGVKVDDTYYNAERIAAIFAGYRQDTTATDSEYVVYYADGRLSRESGESAGKYSYLNTASRFDINSNYRVVLQTTNTFEIKQRVVTLDVSGQSSVYPYDISVDIATIAPIYRLSEKDSALASEIAELVNSITLGTSASIDMAGYDSVTGYKFVLDADETTNIKVAIAEDAQYIVYITEQNTIIIRAKAGATFANTYGFVSLTSFSLPYSQDLFEIVGTPSGEFTSVSWKANIASKNELVDAGSHVVTFSDAKLVNGETELSDKVVVEQIVYTINPAKIVVKPTAEKLAKTYGEDDSVYEIGYAIDTIAGLSISEVSALVGVDEATLNALVSGVYARAIYDKSGKSAGYATRYDSATEGGVIIGTDGAYYGIGIATEFASSNANFVVEATLNDELRLAIDRKEIAIHTKDFVGVSKYFDGTADVLYGTSAMYNIANYLVHTQDDVRLAADAVYSEIGSATLLTQTNIKFSGFALVGDDAHNYVLASIENDGMDSRVEGYEGDIDDGVVITIYYIDNSNGAERITIKMGKISIAKSDITVSKQYDNTYKLGVNNITFKNGAGTSMIATRSDIVLVSGAYKSKNIGTNHLISFVVFVPFDGDIEGIGIENIDDSVNVEKATHGGKNGVMITVTNIGATITKRIINADSISAIEAVNREYNGNAIVDIEYSFAPNALAEGDSKANVALVLHGVIDSKNAGRHTVKTFTYDTKWFDTTHYEVDIESINYRFTSVEAEISKATLTPVVTFADKIYDAKSNVTYSGLSGKFTTTNAQELGDELGKVSFIASDVTFVLSLNGKANADVKIKYVDGKEVYSHNVLVSGMTIVFSGADVEEFKQNFKLAGSRYSALDNQYVAITDIDEGLVADFELLDIAVLQPKEIVLTSNDFKIADKIYDGSTKADITIDIEEDAEGNQRLALDEHKDMLEVVATGKFEEQNARDNIKITVDADSIALNAKNAEGRLIIANYKLVLSYDPEIYGNIKPRPVDVTVSFGKQEYNGQENVKDNQIAYVKDGVLARDKSNVNMFTEGGAYYDDKNVAFDIESNVGAKAGTAYGVVLSNGKTNNYIATNKADAPIEGRTLVAYIKDNGEWVYSSTVDTKDTVAYYYYALEQTQKYLVINSENADKIAQARADGAIVGFKIIDNDDVYMLKLGYEVEGALSLAEPIAYLRGEGTITQRVVRISSSGIQKIVGTTAFEKAYDGTTKFFGVQGTDYEITEAAVSNVVSGDNVRIASVTTVFESARVGTTHVIFTASGITGSDSANYTVEGTSVLSVRLNANITPLTINAQLQDATRVYGSTETPSNVVYTLNGSELTLVGRRFYMNYNEWLLTTGFISDIDGSVSEADNKYVAELSARRYNLVEGEFVQANDGEYIVIGGSNDAISELPTAKAVFTSTRPNAGTKASSYTLSAGKATNYVFNPLYTGEGTSTLEIVKKTLYIVTETKDFAKTYGSATPEVKINVWDANGANGFAGDQWNTIFKVGSVDYGPVAKLGIFNRTTGTITAVDEYAKISADLSADEVYVFYLDAPEGANYDDIANYTIIYQDINSVSLDNGNAVWKLAGANFTKSASTLTITLPELTGISVGSSQENVFTYSKDINWINEVIRGELSTDEVRFLINGIESEAINAGVYEGKIIVKRYISANGDFAKDKNGYYIEWNSGDTNVKITVNKQTISLWADGMSVYYNGSEQSYLDSKLSHTAIADETGITALDKEDYTISYEVYDSKTNTYVATKSVKNAGRYRVTIALTDKFEQKHPNLAKGSSVKADLYVLKAIVNVTISKDGYTGGSAMVDNNKVTSLSAMFDSNAKYEIGYSVAMDEKSNASKIVVGKGQTKLVLSKNGESMSIDQIHEAGKYTFAIVLDDESLDENNYTINGGAGILELTINKISDANGNGIDLGEGTITANRLVVKEVTNGSTLANDAAYLATIKQHVASLSKQAGYEDEARLAAVYRLTLYCDDKVVTPDGTITVSVAMPDTIDSMDGIVLYTVTADGGLQKLTDYKVENGKIVYNTDYVSGIVFVDTNPEGLASWIIYTIVAVVSFNVLVVVATVVAIVIRKARMKRLDQ